MLRHWLDRFLDFRVRKIADPGFRRWAARFPLTRAIARRRTRALFDLTAGFVYSQVLAACVRIRLFDLLVAGPLTSAAIAARTGLTEDAATRLLKAAVALELADLRRDGRYALGDLGAALVGNDGVAAMIEHHAILYDDLRDPLMLLAGKAQTGLQRYWAYAGEGRRQPAEPRRHGDYTALMAASQAFVSAEILQAYPFSRHRRLLDVGGGDASFLIAAAAAVPRLELMLFDLPPVAAIARQRILGAGIAGRAKVYAGSFFDDALPDGADLVTLNRVLHDHDDPAALAILKSVRRAIAPGGTLLVAEPMSGTRGALASGDAYFGFYLLAMGQGRPRTVEELKALLALAGFRRSRLVATSTPLIARLLAASA